LRHGSSRIVENVEENCFGGAEMVEALPESISTYRCTKSLNN